MSNSAFSSSLRSIIEGFFILLPFLLVYLMIGELWDVSLALTQPVFDLLPGALLEDERTLRMAAAVVLVLIFFLIGRFGHTRIARRCGQWFETKLLNRFPPYTVIKNLSLRLAGKDADKQLQPAMLTVADDTRMIVAIVEELPDNYASVFLPMTPTPGLGVLQIVKTDKLEKLECSMAEALGWVLNWGADTKSLFPKGLPSAMSNNDHGETT